MRNSTELVDDDVSPPATQEWSQTMETGAAKFPAIIRIGMACSTVFVLIVVGLFVGPRLAPETTTKGIAESLVRAALGVDMRITGPHELVVLPSIRLTAADLVTVSDTRGAVDLSIDGFEIEVSSLGALSGSFDINRLILGMPRLRLKPGQTEAQRSESEQFDRAWGWWRDMGIKEMRIENGAIAFQTPEGDDFLQIGDVQLGSAAPAEGENPDGINARGSATVNGHAVKLRLSTSDPQLFVAGNRWPYKLSVASALLRGSLDGSLALRERMQATALLDVESDKFGTLMRRVGWQGEIAADQTLRLKTKLTRTGDAVEVENIQLELGETRLGGEIKVNTDLPNGPRLSGALRAEMLAFGPLATDTVLFAAPMLPVGELNVNWKQGKLFGHSIGTGTARLEKAQGTHGTTIELGEIDAYGGTVRGTATLDSSEGYQALHFSGKAVDVAMSFLSSNKMAIDAAPITGRATITLNLFSIGADSGQMREALSGRADLLVNEGALRIPTLAEGLEIDGDGTQVRFDSLNGRFDVAEGIARSDDLLLRAATTSLVGKGRVDLADGTIDLDVGRIDGDDTSGGLTRYRVRGSTSDISVEAVN